MAVPDGPLVNAGSGPHDPKPWSNIDGSWQARFAGQPALARVASRLLGVEIGHWPSGVRYHDVRRGLGLPAHSVAVVYSSHLLEHLHRDDALAFLREARRVLMPGGVCRAVVPDVEAIVGWYLAHQREPIETHREPSSDLLMGMLQLRPRSSMHGGRGPLGWFRRSANLHEHKWMYDRLGLVALFNEAGFAGASAREFLDSDIPKDALEQVERPDRVCNGAGICVEARV